MGLQPDPTISRGSSPTENQQPAQMTTEEIRVLLSSLMVSGWSGTLIGILEQPRPVPVFTDTELSRIAEPIARAFQQAGPTERVFFPYQSRRRNTVKNAPPAHCFCGDGIFMSCSRITRLHRGRYGRRRGEGSAGHERHEIVGRGTGHCSHGARRGRTTLGPFRNRTPLAQCEGCHRAATPARSSFCLKRHLPYRFLRPVQRVSERTTAGPRGPRATRQMIFAFRYES